MKIGSRSRPFQGMDKFINAIPPLVAAELRYCYPHLLVRLRFPNAQKPFSVFGIRECSSRNHIFTPLKSQLRLILGDTFWKLCHYQSYFFSYRMKLRSSRYVHFCSSINTFGTFFADLCTVRCTNTGVNPLVLRVQQHLIVERHLRRPLHHVLDRVMPESGRRGVIMIRNV